MHRWGTPLSYPHAYKHIHNISKNFVRSKVTLFSSRSSWWVAAWSSDVPEYFMYAVSGCNCTGAIGLTEGLWRGHLVVQISFYSYQAFWRWRQRPQSYKGPKVGHSNPIASALCCTQWELLNVSKRSYALACHSCRIFFVWYFSAFFEIILKILNYEVIFRVQYRLTSIDSTCGIMFSKIISNLFLLFFKVYNGIEWGLRINIKVINGTISISISMYFLGVKCMI